MSGATVLDELFTIIRQRMEGDSEESYVATLTKGGSNNVLKKVIEEAGEAVLAAKDEDRVAIIRETADLWFHSLVMLAYRDISLHEIFDELERRRGMSGILEKKNR